MIGRTLGHYQITSQLGKGGMGEVYQAKDNKLGRDVAIKVLPEEFAKDSDRIARFQREAKLLASLNHPNIAAIYGLEQSDKTNFLVLELVEGETLADRIRAGPIPVEDALKLALQIAEALEAAHEKGVIHRDLKPANIKVTPEGKVKVLDFGLAKAFAGEQENLNLSNSPTLSDAATRQGVILGTAAYMSPEQARGKPVDKRTDIWGFGCVLYEMLTGQAAFQGEDVTEILAAVVKSGANLDLLPANIHPRVREVITRCLQKDLRRRYSGITDARYEIEQSLADPSGVLLQPVAKVESRNKLKTILPWVAATLVLTAIIVGVAVWQLKPPEARQVIRSEYSLPEGQQINNINTLTLAVSHDGRQLVYVTAKGLYRRSLDEFNAKLISGTETSPAYPFFSPDGKWIGFFSSTDRKLKKVAISGGVPETICDATNIAGASWGADDSIVFAEFRMDLKRVSANSGTPKTIAKGSIFHPQLLPDGKSVLFTFGDAPYKICVLSLKSGDRSELFAGDNARYVATGHIVYVLENNLMAVPFDLKTLKVTAEPAAVLQGVYRALATTAPHYAVSDSGTLVYMPGTVGSSVVGRSLVWVDREGKAQPLAAQPNDYRSLRISPDGKKVALTIYPANAKPDIYIWDIVRENMTRLTFNEASDNPVWILDGQRVAFWTGVTMINSVIWSKAADGTGVDEQLGSVPGRFIVPWSWSSARKILVALEYAGATNWDIGPLSMEGDHKWKPLLQEKYSEYQPEISPDGRWMAYSSDESGRFEIHMRPFPDVNRGRWQVSDSGGDTPLWSPDGRQLFYRNGDSVMAVAVEAGQTFKRGKPEELFQGMYSSLSMDFKNTWDLTPDGKRFLMMKEPDTTAGPGKINIVLNWTEELKRRVPAK